MNDIRRPPREVVEALGRIGTDPAQTEGDEK